ncbi:MAG: hypothetical protein M3P14_02940, partial [Chloroflexota bacterium]|nr:hypothetical protein [Chloroflexota bacterium]
MDITLVNRRMGQRLAELREQDGRLAPDQRLLAEQRNTIAGEIGTLEIAIKLNTKYGQEQESIPQEQIPA